jgi:hypothetical protein
MTPDPLDGTFKTAEEAKAYEQKCEMLCDGDAWHFECDCIGEDCEDGCEGF